MMILKSVERGLADCLLLDRFGSAFGEGIEAKQHKLYVLLVGLYANRTAPLEVASGTVRATLAGPVPDFRLQV